MEEILPILIGLPFAVFVMAKALIDAGKLPGGPMPGPVARPTNTQAPIDTAEPHPEPSNGTELDPEEKATIQRVVEIRDRVEARRSALTRMGLEITNADKW